MAEKQSQARILAAARKRFAHFGYGKTSMAEIAGDCGMSPGNLYRFFPGKLDIAEAIATADYEAHLSHLRRQLAQPGRSVREKLRGVLFEGLRRTYNKLEKDPRALELAQVIAAERPAFAGWMLERERTLMVALMEEGALRGEFQVADKNFTAEMIQSATMKFRVPQLWSRLSLARLERELDGVLTLLIEGLGQASPVRLHEEAV
jgi:AcrR family transcriptional regulator